MNKQIKESLIVNLMSKSPEKAVTQNGRRIYVPENTAWAEFTSVVNSAIQNQAYDSVIVHVNDAIDFTAKGTANRVTIKINQICKAATEADKAVLNDASHDVWYFMNPSWHDMFNAPRYAPSDEDVLSKFNSYGTEDAWQEHQSKVWERMADMMPLSARAAYGTPNHVAQLTDPKRGLERKDLSGFWSFKSNKVITPAVMGDDMVGMPGVEGREYDGFTITTVTDGVAVERPLSVRSLKTVGLSGAAIPMANVHGHVPKYQIATDPSKVNVTLKARAADGISIQKSEYFDKKTDTFLFSFTDGRESKLKVAAASDSGKVTFSDANGKFEAKMKDDLFPVLNERGYDIPPLIATLRIEPSAKYIWQSRGTMVGSEEVTKIVSPSNAGFIVGREPKNGADDYLVLVAEGALKGHIVAKYCDVCDRLGNSFGDTVAGDYGIIVAQVPGVSHAFVESVSPVYSQYKVAGTYIAMDADGRQNGAVANGIHSAYECLSEYSTVTVMSWNPAQKGLDDALLAVAQGKITLEEMGIAFGTPDELFPREGAQMPNPYRLDGTRANQQSWIAEYEESSKDTNAKIRAAQQGTKERKSGAGKPPVDTTARVVSEERTQPAPARPTFPQSPLLQAGTAAQPKPAPAQPKPAVQKPVQRPVAAQPKPAQPKPAVQKPVQRPAAALRQPAHQRQAQPQNAGQQPDPGILAIRDEIRRRISEGKQAQSGPAKPAASAMDMTQRISAIQEEIRRRAAELAQKNPKKNVAERAGAIKSSGQALNENISTFRTARADLTIE